MKNEKKVTLLLLLFCFIWEEFSDKIKDTIENIFIAYPYFFSVICSVLLVDKYRAKLHQQSHDK